MKTCGILLLLLASIVLVRGQNNEELGSICYLKELVKLKCQGDVESACANCVYQNVKEKCPYDSATGPPDCNKLQGCTFALELDC